MSSKPESAPGEADWEALGKHRLRVDGDVLRLICEGGFDLAEMQRVVQESNDIGERYGYVMVCLDATRAAWSTPEARKYQASAIRDKILPNHTVVMGANIMIRATVGLVHRAVHLITGKTLNSSFVDSEEAALAVLSKCRQQFIAQGVARTPLRNDTT